MARETLIEASRRLAREEDPSDQQLAKAKRWFRRWRAAGQPRLRDPKGRFRHLTRAESLAQVVVTFGEPNPAMDALPMVRIKEPLQFAISTQLPEVR